MAIEALKRVSDIPAVKKQKEVTPPEGQRQQKRQKERRRQEKGKVDIKV